MDSSQKFEVIYNGINHIFNIEKKNEETLQINCSRNNIYFMGSIDLRSEYCFLLELRDIIFEKQNIIKDSSEEEIKIKYKINKIIKNIKSFSKTIENHIKVGEYNLSFDNNNIYIQTIQEEKTYIFQIRNEGYNENEIKNNFSDLISNKYLKFNKENDNIYLSIQYNCSLSLSRNTEDKKTNETTTSGNKVNSIIPFKELNNFHSELLNQEQIYLNNGNKTDYSKDIIDEIKSKQNFINEDYHLLENEIQKLKETAKLMIFPKDRPIPNKEKGIEIDSYIIGKVDDFNFINQNLLKVNNCNKVQYELLYRASRDRDLGKIFKEKCKNSRETLVLVKSEENQIFGGYTSQIWNNSGLEYDDSKAFCFSINKKKIYKKKPFKNAIICDKDSGPIFCNMFKISNKFFTNKQKSQAFDKKSSNYNNQEEDYEINGGKQSFTVYELEAFRIRSIV